MMFDSPPFVLHFKEHIRNWSYTHLYGLHYWWSSSMYDCQAKVVYLLTGRAKSDCFFVFSKISAITWSLAYHKKILLLHFCFVGLKFGEKWMFLYRLLCGQKRVTSLCNFSHSHYNIKQTAYKTDDLLISSRSCGYQIKWPAPISADNTSTGSIKPTNNPNRA